MGKREAHQAVRSHQPPLEVATQLRMHYCDASDLPRWLATCRSHPMALVSFQAPALQSLTFPTMTVDLPQLVGPSQVELWSSDQPVSLYREKGFTAGMSSDLLAATIELDEVPGAGLERTTEEAYRLLLSQLHKLGFPHLIRLWNYFPEINKEEGGLERYRQFCVGRHRALVKLLPGFPESLPAGTAVGTRSGPLQILALAGTHPGIHLGNPRQTHAYDYPQHYGPCSPSFARATLVRFETEVQLYIAGTSSVVGHESRHLGHPDDQARETVSNLLALMAHADRSCGSLEGSLSQQGHYKVYIRHPEHLASTHTALQSSFIATQNVLYLQGELCRRELLVEIEGFVSTDW